MNTEGFGPVAAPDARVLILGTLPGQESLRRREYYAHPRNGFWPIMEAVFGVSAQLPYDERTRQLADAGVALWDVCAAGNRPGSLDQAIVRGTEVPNDFNRFLQSHPQVRLICFNGAKARDLFRKHVELDVPLPLFGLPSTSPAHAAMSLGEKLELWSDVLKKCR